MKKYMRELIYNKERRRWYLEEEKNNNNILLVSRIIKYNEKKISYNYIKIIFEENDEINDNKIICDFYKLKAYTKDEFNLYRTFGNEIIKGHNIKITA